ncbi:RidA family protein [Nitratireductor sp. ZSWI3]|uniref:RidA family protein n=1 Tax=Nitratireductor sp. ZSWI3 TaxID=2966359 RepID=UPI00215004CD|nr:RidA family protein [Nitratireductor sp. ZSWI3]MCR4265817.1 RidA family protein [Nitratireductor sp. ZSWI3]
MSGHGLTGAAIERRISELGLELPPVTPPQFIYVPVLVHEDIAHVSGQIPWIGGEVQFRGKLGAETSLEDGQAAARLCVLNAIAQLRLELGDLERIARFLKLTGFVASAAGFNMQPKVIDGASQLLGEIFGEQGRHARSAIGVAELPRDVPVEVELTVALHR